MYRLPIIILSFLLSIASYAQSSGIATVKKVAKTDAIKFFNLIPQGQENDYGFKSREDFSKIEIGEPYQVYFVVKRDNKVNFQSSNNWRVPVLVNGKSIALLTVATTDEGAQIVDFGAKGLAKKLQEFEKNYNSANERVLLRNTYLSTDFIAPQFSALIGSETNGLISINSVSNAVLYPVAAIQNASIKPSSFVSATLSATVK